MKYLKDIIAIVAMIGMVIVLVTYRYEIRDLFRGDSPDVTPYLEIIAEHQDHFDNIQKEYHTVHRQDSIKLALKEHSYDSLLTIQSNQKKAHVTEIKNIARIPVDSNLRLLTAELDSLRSRFNTGDYR